MIKANNLSDLTNKTEARKNLDVYGKSEVDAKIQNATPNIDLSGYAKKQHAHTIADVTNLQLSLDGKAPKVHTHTTVEITDLQTKLDAKLDKSEKGQPNGVATLNANGAIDSKHIPPYLENPLVYQNRTKFPPTGRIGKLYMDEETGNLYIWQNNKYHEYFSIQAERNEEILHKEGAIKYSNFTLKGTGVFAWTKLGTFE